MVFTFSELQRENEELRRRYGILEKYKYKADDLMDAKDNEIAALKAQSTEQSETDNGEWSVGYNRVSGDWYVESSDFTHSEREAKEIAEELASLKQQLAEAKKDAERAINALRLIKAMPHSHEAIRTCIQTLAAIDQAMREGE